MIRVLSGDLDRLWRIVSLPESSHIAALERFARTPSREIM
jgi:hypothetical protein